MAIFEDEFMDIQSGMVALCLEAAGDANVEVVYIYGSIEGGMTSFNTFFRMGGVVRGLTEVVPDRSLALQVLDLGTDDLGRLRTLCGERGRACPTEIRGRYETATGGYRVHYSYDPIVADPDYGISPATVFDTWMDDVQSGKDDLDPAVAPGSSS